MLTAISLQERTKSASVERRFVPMADGQVRWRALAFLLTAQRTLYDQRAATLSSSSEKSRIATGRTRAQTPGSAYVQVGSYIANARGRSRSRAHGRWNDTGGSRRQNVDNEECCFTSGERCVHPPDIDHHREIRGSGGRVRRNSRADEAIVLALQTSLGIVGPLDLRLSLSGQKRGSPVMAASNGNKVVE